MCFKEGGTGYWLQVTTPNWPDPSTKATFAPLGCQLDNNTFLGQSFMGKGRSTHTRTCLRVLVHCEARLLSGCLRSIVHAISPPLLDLLNFYFSSSFFLCSGFLPSSSAYLFLFFLSLSLSTGLTLSSSELQRAAPVLETARLCSTGTTSCANGTAGHLTDYACTSTQTRDASWSILDTVFAGTSTTGMASQSIELATVRTTIESNYCLLFLSFLFLFLFLSISFEVLDFVGYSKQQKSNIPLFSSY